MTSVSVMLVDFAAGEQGKTHETPGEFAVTSRENFAAVSCVSDSSRNRSESVALSEVCAGCGLPCCKRKILRSTNDAAWV